MKNMSRVIVDLTSMRPATHKAMPAVGSRSMADFSTLDVGVNGLCVRGSLLGAGPNNQRVQRAENFL